MTKRVKMTHHPLFTGCLDRDCLFADNSKGMHTNGGCSCARELGRHPEGFKAVQTIRFLRKQLEILKAK